MLVSPSQFSLVGPVRRRCVPSCAVLCCVVLIYTRDSAECCDCACSRAGWHVTTSLDIMFLSPTRIMVWNSYQPPFWKIRLTYKTHSVVGFVGVFDWQVSFYESCFVLSKQIISLNNFSTEFWQICFDCPKRFVYFGFITLGDFSWYFLDWCLPSVYNRLTSTITGNEFGITNNCKCSVSYANVHRGNLRQPLSLWVLFVHIAISLCNVSSVKFLGFFARGRPTLNFWRVL